MDISRPEGQPVNMICQCVSSPMRQLRKACRHGTLSSRDKIVPSHLKSESDSLLAETSFAPILAVFIHYIVWLGHSLVILFCILERE